MSNIVRLKDLCIGHGEYGIAAAGEPYSEDKYRYLRITDISDYGELLDSEKKSISCDGCENYFLEENDIVFARTGNSTGRAFLYESRYGRLVYAGFLIKFHLDDKKVNPKYVKYYTISDIYKKWITYNPDGSTRGNMNADDLAEIPVILPPREFQDKIVGLLEPIFLKVENNNKTIEELERFANTIFQYWFLQYNFPDDDGKPYQSSGGEMVWNKKLNRKIPVGWKVKELKEFFTSGRGVSYTSAEIDNGGVPMINLASFSPDGSYKVDGLKTYSGNYTVDKMLKPYDLIMCNTQQTAIDYEKDIIGKTLLVPDIFEGDIISSHHVTTLKVKNQNMKFWLNRLFNTHFFHEYAAHNTNGTNILGLIFDGIELCVMDIPDERVLKSFADFSLAIEREKSKIFLENKELTSMRDFYLPLLISEQLQCKQ